jgi:hypothetical protein
MRLSRSSRRRAGVSSVELGAEELARLVELLAHGAVEFGSGDLVPVHTRRVRAFVEEITKAFYTDETQPRHDDQDEHEHHQALMVAKEIEHA